MRSILPFGKQVTHTRDLSVPDSIELRDLARSRVCAESHKPRLHQQKLVWLRSMTDEMHNKRQGASAEVEERNRWQNRENQRKSN